MQQWFNSRKVRRSISFSEACLIVIFVKRCSVLAVGFRLERGKLFTAFVKHGGQVVDLAVAVHFVASSLFVFKSMRVNDLLRVLQLFVDEGVGSSEVTLFEGLLSGSMSEE